MKTEVRNRYESIPKRSFRNSIIRLLEENYKILGSHKVLSLLADDIVNLHREFYPGLDRSRFGHVVWRTTGAQCKKPSYGTKVEDYEVKTVILPLITDEDIERLIAPTVGEIHYLAQACFISPGYPIVLADAHNRCKITRDRKDRLNAQLISELQRQGYHPVDFETWSQDPHKIHEQ